MLKGIQFKWFSATHGNSSLADTSLSSLAKRHGEIWVTVHRFKEKNPNNIRSLRFNEVISVAKKKA